MTNQLSLEILSPAERRASICRILARGLLRLRSREDSSPERLDNSPDQSGPPTLEEPGEKR